MSWLFLLNTRLPATRIIVWVYIYIYIYINVCMYVCMYVYSIFHYFDCAGKPSRTLSWWCFNPGIAMQEFSRMGVRSIILTSGTLSPLDSFAQELKLWVSFCRLYLVKNLSDFKKMLTREFGSTSEIFPFGWKTLMSYPQIRYGLVLYQLVHQVAHWTHLIEPVIL